jgi:methionyl-tRNA formyltransferase
MTVSYLVATTRPWNIAQYDKFVVGAQGEWHLIDQPEALTRELIERIRPRYVFFPHWSWKVSAEIFNAAECVLFHMTDLPFGRGGSPLQNLIGRGETVTKVSAVRMTEEIDAGAIYLKRPMSLEGAADDIFRRLSVLIFEMIGEIVATTPIPVPQKGSPTYFKRRTPDQSALPDAVTPHGLYDHIRMLDADTYPRAFLDFGRWRMEFSGAALSDDGVTASVSIRTRNEGE